MKYALTRWARIPAYRTVLVITLFLEEVVVHGIM
jgi:hypothetical protein